MENAEEFVEMDPMHYKAMGIPLLSHDRLRVQARRGAAMQEEGGGAKRRGGS